MSLRSAVPLALFIASSVGLSTVGLATSSASTRTFSKNILFGISDQQDVGFSAMYDNADFKALRFQKTRVIISWDESTSGTKGAELRAACQQSWDHGKRPMVSLASHPQAGTANPPRSDSDWRRAFNLVNMCNSPKGSMRGYADIEIANEPDIAYTAMTPAQAVQGLKTARASYGSKARISPFALAVSGASKTWQSSWLTSWKHANYPAIDAIGYHPYGDSNSGKSSLVPLVTSFAKQWNQHPKSKRGDIPEVWLTEFSVWHSQQKPCVAPLEPNPSNFSSMPAEQQQADMQRRIGKQRDSARRFDGSSVIDDNAGRFWVIPEAFQQMKSRSKVEEKLAVASAYMCYKLDSNLAQADRSAGKKQYFTLQAPNSSVESSKATRYVKMVNYWANLTWSGHKTKWLNRVYWYEWANARCTRPDSIFFGPIGSKSPSQAPSNANGYSLNSGGCGDDHHAAWQSGFYGYSSNSQYFEPSPITGIIKAARG